MVGTIAYAAAAARVLHGCLLLLFPVPAWTNAQCSELGEWLYHDVAIVERLAQREALPCLLASCSGMYNRERNALSRKVIVWAPMAAEILPGLSSGLTARLIPRHDEADDGMHRLNTTLTCMPQTAVTGDC